MPSVSVPFGVANFDQMTSEGSGKYKTDVEKKCVQCHEKFVSKRDTQSQGGYLSGFPFYRVVFPTLCPEGSLHLMHTVCFYNKIKDCDHETEVYCQGSSCNRKIVICEDVKDKLKCWIDIDEDYYPVLQLVLQYKKDGRFDYGQVTDLQEKTYTLGGVIDEDWHLKKLYVDANLILGDTYLDLCQSEESVDRAIRAYQQALNCSNAHSVDATERMERAKTLKCQWLVKRATHLECNWLLEGNQNYLGKVLDDCFSEVAKKNTEYPSNEIIRRCLADLHVLRAKIALDSLGDKGIAVLEEVKAFLEREDVSEDYEATLENLCKNKCGNLLRISKENPEINLSIRFNLLDKLRAYYPYNAEINSCSSMIYRMHWMKGENLAKD